MTNMELYHYGIKGMRWGHRKARPQMSGAARSARSARRKQIAKRVALGVGAAAGAAALGYGAYRYGKNPINKAKLETHLSNARLKVGDATDMVRAHGVKGSAREAYRKLNGPAAKARREVKRMQRGDRLHDVAGRVVNVGAQAKYLGVRGSARVVGQKGASAAQKVGSAAKTRAKNAKDGAQIIGYGARYAGGVLGKRAGNAAGGAAQKVGSTVGGYVLGGKRSKTRANIRGAGEKLRQARAAASTLAGAYSTRRKYQGKHAAHFAYDSPGEALYHFALDPYGRYAIL